MKQVGLGPSHAKSGQPRLGLISLSLGQAHIALGWVWVNLGPNEVYVSSG